MVDTEKLKILDKVVQERAGGSLLAGSLLAGSAVGGISLGGAFLGEGLTKEEKQAKLAVTKAAHPEKFADSLAVAKAAKEYYASERAKTIAQAEAHRVSRGGKPFTKAEVVELNKELRQLQKQNKNKIRYEQQKSLATSAGFSSVSAYNAHKQGKEAPVRTKAPRKSKDLTSVLSKLGIS